MARTTETAGGNYSNAYDAGGGLTDNDILDIILGSNRTVTTSPSSLTTQRQGEQTTGTSSNLGQLINAVPDAKSNNNDDPITRAFSQTSDSNSGNNSQTNNSKQSDPRWQRLYEDAIRQQVAAGSTATADQLRQAAKDAANINYDLGADNRSAGNDYATAIAAGSNVVPKTYNANAGTGVTTGGGSNTGGGTNTGSQFGTSLQPGSNTPFGRVIGNLPLGLGLEWHNLLLQQAKAMADQTGYQYTWDPTANNGQGAYVQGQKTLTAQLQESQIALANASKLFQEAALTGTYNGQPTLAAQQLKQQADQFAQSMGLSRDQLAEQIRQFNASLSFQQQQVAFNQANTLAQLAANPRTSIQASFLGSTRGGLGPDQAGPMAGLSAFQQALTGAQPGVQQAQIMQGPDQAQPGSAAHYATETRPDGSQVLYFGTPTRLADGSMANVPVGAFSRAIMEGKPVPSAGDIGTTGGYTTTEQVRSNFNPNRVRLADYLRASPSEQAQLQGVASYAGYSPEDFTSTLSKFAPKERSISGGARAY
jgi:hypothetical protein